MPIAAIALLLLMQARPLPPADECARIATDYVVALYHDDRPTLESLQVWPLGIGATAESAWSLGGLRADHIAAAQSLAHDNLGPTVWTRVQVDTDHGHLTYDVGVERGIDYYLPDFSDWANAVFVGPDDDTAWQTDKIIIPLEHVRPYVVVLVYRY